MAISSDRSVLCVGHIDQTIKVYKNISGTFTLVQTIAVGYVPFFMKLASQKMGVVGISSELKFFDYDGTNFQYEGTFTLNDTLIACLTTSDDFGLVTTGGNSNNMTVIKRNNGTYELFRSEPIGSFILSISTDKLFQYYVISTTLQVYVFY